MGDGLVKDAGLGYLEWFYDGRTVAFRGYYKVCVHG